MSTEPREQHEVSTVFGIESVFPTKSRFCNTSSFYDCHVFADRDTTKADLYGASLGGEGEEIVRRPRGQKIIVELACVMCKRGRVVG